MAQLRRNKRTGEVQEMRGGQWVTTTPGSAAQAPAAQGGPAFSIPTRPADPTMPFKVTEAEYGAQAAPHAAAKVRTDAKTAAATAPYVARKAAADAKKAEYDMKKAEYDARPPFTPELFAAAREDAANKINIVRSIRKRLKQNDGFMGIDLIPETGLGGQIASKVGGTIASDIAADIKTLESGGALAEVTRLIKETGKNPFTPMSNYESELLSGNIGSLTLNQSRENLLKHLGAYERAYSRAFLGAKGKPEALGGARSKQNKLPPGWSIEEVR